MACPAMCNEKNIFEPLQILRDVAQGEETAVPLVPSLCSSSGPYTIYLPAKGLTFRYLN